MNILLTRTLRKGQWHTSRLMITSTVCFSLLAGCSGGTDGPPRFQVSGTVSFEGKPIPVGMIYFNPDTSRGNSGPGSAAEILNGKYQTPVGKGIIGGPTKVVIDGFDGVEVKKSGEIIPQGNALFPTYEEQVDLPRKTSSQDFVVKKP